MHNHRIRPSRSLLTAFVTGFVTLAVPASGQMISEDLKLLPSDGLAEAEFGWSIDIDNGLVAIGMPRDTVNGSNSGSAYLFDAMTGVQLAKLLPNDGSESDTFGWSIAIDNGTVAVGARYDDVNGWHNGSAYLFDAATGAQIAKLIPSDGDRGDTFGYSIAIDNGVVALGVPLDEDNNVSSGSAYLFDVATGVQLIKLHPNDGANFDQFGHSIAIGDGIVAVGAKWADDNGDRSGAAYVFDAVTGAQLAKLLPLDGAAGDRFGWSIAIDSGVVAVGARDDDDNGSGSGSAYLFDAATGVQIAKLLASDGKAGNQFGYSLSIDQGVVAVGAHQDGDNGFFSGSAYLFDASTGVQIAAMLASDGDSRDLFGSSIAINNGLVAVGAWQDSDNGNDSGSAYVLDFACLADLTGDGAVNTQDFITFLGLWAAESPLADWTVDDIVNTQDFIAFLNAWVAGCP